MSRIKWPEKYGLQHYKISGEPLEEPNSRNIQYQYGHNQAIDACITAEKESRVSVEELKNLIDNVFEEWEAPSQQVYSKAIAQAIYDKIYGEE